MLNLEGPPLDDIKLRLSVGQSQIMLNLEGPPLDHIKLRCSVGQSQIMLNFQGSMLNSDGKSWIMIQKYNNQVERRIT